MTVWPSIIDPWPGMQGQTVTPQLADLLPIMVDSLSGRERRATVDGLIEAMLSRLGGTTLSGTTLNGTTHGIAQTELIAADIPAGLLDSAGRALEYRMWGLWTWTASATITLRARWDHGSTVDLGTFAANGFGTTGTNQPVVMTGRVACSQAGSSGRLVSSHEVVTGVRMGAVTSPNTYTSHDLEADGRLEITGQLSAAGSPANTFAPICLTWHRTR